jgi:hypothetical protein
MIRMRAVAANNSRELRTGGGPTIRMRRFAPACPRTRRLQRERYLIRKLSLVSLVPFPGGRPSRFAFLAIDTSLIRKPRL